MATEAIRIFEHSGARRGEVGRRGGNVLNSGDEANKPDGKKARTAAPSKDRDMGSALRSVWQKTVEEDIPDDMLTLLGKLD